MNLAKYCFWFQVNCILSYLLSKMFAEYSEYYFSSCLKQSLIDLYSYFTVWIWYWCKCRFCNVVLVENFCTYFDDIYRDFRFSTMKCVACSCMLLLGWWPYFQPGMVLCIRLWFLCALLEFGLRGGLCVPL